MKKFIISISLALLLFVAFFLMLMGKPLKTISTDIDKLTSGKRVGYFIGLLVGFFTRKLFISLDTDNAN